MMRVLAPLLALVLVGTGCASTASSKKGPAGSFGRVDGRPDAHRFLAADASRAKAAGAAKVEVVAIEAGAAGDRIGGLLDVPTDSCVLLIARASEGVDDIDLFAYGDDGTLFGSDERPDKTPTLLVCPPHPPRLYIAARVAAGHGLVAVGAQKVARADADRVGKLLSAKGWRGDRAGRLEAWPNLDEKIAEHLRGIGSRWQEVRRTAVPIDASLPTHLSAVVEEDRCLDVLVVPGEDVAHLDVAALDEGGRIVGRATAHGRERFAVLCSPFKAIVNIEVRPHSGRGFAAVVMNKTRDAGVQALDSRVPIFDLAPVGNVADAKDKLGSELERHGYRAAKTVVEGTFAVGRRESTTLELKSGCTRIDVVVGRPARGVEGWVWSSGGVLSAHQRGTHGTTMFACGSGGSVRLDTEPLARGGPFVVELRHEPDVPRPLVDHPLAADRLLSRMLARGVIKRPTQVGAAKVVSVSATQRETIDATVPIGRCIDVTLALGPGASGAEVRLLDSTTNKELELARGNESASARACALDRGQTLTVRAEVRAVTGSTSGLVATRMLAPKD